MIKVRQTKFTNQETGECGNCFQACLASLLEIPIDDIIDTGHLAQQAQESSDNTIFWNGVEQWLESIGYELSLVTNHKEYLEQDPVGCNVHYILTGHSPRFPDDHHSVIARGGAVVWDPHPSDAGLLDFCDAMILEPLGTREQRNNELNTEYVNDR